MALTTYTNSPNVQAGPKNPKAQPIKPIGGVGGVVGMPTNAAYKAPIYKIDPTVAAAQQLDYERRQARKKKEAYLNMGFGSNNLLGSGASGIARQTLLGA